jgi:ribosomal protein L21
MPRKKIWAMLKKKKRKSMPRGMRKKWTSIQMNKIMGT